ncbi:APC family permease [Paenibacillus daejeonensis]|uniref:APC family permease n=1 Tax=Paenibacillus daejeonensis TaxID=135193 RepID=UPI000376292E|nr:APC family permease [Paenibacillus daejeonensis]
MIIMIVGLALFAAVCMLSVVLAVSVQRRMPAASTPAQQAGAGYLQFLEDKRQLNAQGYAQQLRRGRSGFSSFALSFATMSVIGGTVLYYGPVYEMAGPWAFGLGLPLVALFAVLTSAVTAEMAASDPSSGGVYRWARRAGSSRGWGRLALQLRTGSDLCMLLLLNGGAAVLLDALVAGWLGYASNMMSVVLWTWLLLALQAGLAMQGLQLNQRAISGSAWLQLLLVAVIVGGLLLLFKPGLQPAAYLFSAGSHGNGEYAWLQLVAALVLLQRLFLGWEASAAGTEETVRPAVNVPWSMYLSTVYGFIFVYALCVFVTLSIMDVAVTTGSSNLFLVLTADSWGRLSSFLHPILYIGAILCLWISGLGTLTSASRQWFAYHRDGRSSWSRWLQHIDNRKQTPRRIILLLALGTGLIILMLALWQPWVAAGTSSLIYLSAAGSLSFNLSLAIPLALRYWSNRADRPDDDKRQRGWHLGRLSRPLQALVLLWLLLSAAGAIVLLSPLAGLHLGIGLLLLGLLWPLIRLGARRTSVNPVPGRAELLSQERGYRQL